MIMNIMSSIIEENMSQNSQGHTRHMNLCGSFERQLKSPDTHSRDDNRFLALLLCKNTPVLTTCPIMLCSNTPLSAQEPNGCKFETVTDARIRKDNNLKNSFQCTNLVLRQ